MAGLTKEDTMTDEAVAALAEALPEHFWDAHREGLAERTTIAALPEGCS